MASPYDFVHSADSYLFPATSQLQTSIPLWMRLNAYAYAENALNRFEASQAGRGETNIPTLSKLLANIVVPAQISFISTTAIPYGKKATDATMSTPSYFGLGDIKTAFDDFLGYYGSMVQGGGESVAQEMGFGGALPEPDMYDLAFVGGGSYRSFNLSLNLPCFTEQDSEVASQIADAFEAFCLPTGTSWGNLTNTKFFNPPLWTFGVSKTLSSVKFDKSWTGQPQLSVLQTVKIKRVPLESSSLVAVGSNLKPMVYGISLAFSELEPSLRVPLQNTITSRSGLIASGRSQAVGIR